MMGAPDQQLRQREQVLAWLRLLSSRASVLASELSYARENLRLGVISPEEALIWIEETDPLLRPIVEAN